MKHPKTTSCQSYLLDFPATNSFLVVKTIEMPNKCRSWHFGRDVALGEAGCALLLGLTDNKDRVLRHDGAGRCPCVSSQLSLAWGKTEDKWRGLEKETGKQRSIFFVWMAPWEWNRDHIQQWPNFSATHCREAGMKRIKEDGEKALKSRSRHFPSLWRRFDVREGVQRRG